MHILQRIQEVSHKVAQRCEKDNGAMGNEKHLLTRDWYRLQYLYGGVDLCNQMTSLNKAKKQKHWCLESEILSLQDRFFDLKKHRKTTERIFCVVYVYLSCTMSWGNLFLGLSHKIMLPAEEGKNAICTLVRLSYMSNMADKRTLCFLFFPKILSDLYNL